MQNPRGDRAVPGALNLGQSTATNISNAFLLFSFTSPIIFAVISDVCLGKFKTLMIGMGCYICGCLILTLTSIPIALDHGAGVPGLGVALFFIALAAASVKATVAPFIGDQYAMDTPKTIMRCDGTLAVVDGTRTLQFLYNAYYWLTNIASLSIVAITFLERKIDFWAAYVLPTAFLCVPIVTLIIGSHKLTTITPEGNVLIQGSKVLWCAALSGFQVDKTMPAYQEAHKRRIVTWNATTVADIKQALSACRVLFSLVIFYLCVNQIFNNLVSQAGQMKLGEVPNDFIQVFSAVACIILGPLLQGIFEILAKYQIHYGPIARITTAFLFCGIAMAYSAGLQKLIYSAGPCYDRPLACKESEGGRISNEVSVWAQVPVYFLLGVAEILGFVTVFEYSYEHAPGNMKSIIQAVGQLTAGVASALGMAISPTAKDPNLVVMYSCLAGAAGGSALLFWLWFGKYDSIGR